MSAKLFGLKIGRGSILESIFVQVEICLDNSPRELVISSRGFGASRQPLETPNGFHVFTFHVFSPPHKLASISVEVGGGEILVANLLVKLASEIRALDKCCLSNSPRELCHKFSGRRRKPQPLETPNGLTVLSD